MNGYICYFMGRTWECHADTSYQATQLAIKHFNPSKKYKHMMHVMIAEKDGKPVIHDTAGL